ncbi:MAG: hypothetical protein KJ995_06070 [Candidatus Omnitrophica bacterium]|nr:hypothetical protein [Candidatus Omnitrophota bacterium]MBU1127629.1 hypothetical protein [Candidatus Omnitrophota bacterium]MBU1851953.1 hypothetical protein [Candidatus Omnitrophota bacterium]
MRSLRSGLLVCLVVCAAGVSMLLAGCGGDGEPQKTEQPKSVEVGNMPSKKPITEEKTYYGFEEDLAGWEIPAWAAGKSDYVATDLVLSKDFASEGTSSMRATVVFPGNSWSAGLVEIQQYLDLSAYRVISADVYIPADAPQGLKANLILTVGNNWKFVEMNQSVPLIPGEWTTVRASVEPGSYDWKRVVPDEDFAKDVRKIAVRIISNRKPVYTGPVYIDNVRVGR